MKILILVIPFFLTSCVIGINASLEAERVIKTKEYVREKGFYSTSAAYRLNFGYAHPKYAAIYLGLGYQDQNYSFSEQLMNTLGSLNLVLLNEENSIKLKYEIASDVVSDDLLRYNTESSLFNSRTFSVGYGYRFDTNFILGTEIFYRESYFDGNPQLFNSAGILISLDILLFLTKPNFGPWSFMI